MSNEQSRLQRALSLPGKIVSWLVVVLVLSVIGSVAAAWFGLSTLADWEGRIPVLGGALTVNSLVDLQWYIFALIVLFGGIWSLLEHRHVTVDFIAIRFTARTRGWITILGNTFLLLPLCVLVIRYGADFAATAWRTGEGSNQGGLAAHWLIKGALPLSFALLGLAGIAQSVETFRAIRKGHETGTGGDHAG